MAYVLQVIDTVLPSHRHIYSTPVANKQVGFNFLKHKELGNVSRVVEVDPNDPFTRILTLTYKDKATFEMIKQELLDLGITNNRPEGIEIISFTVLEDN